MSLVFSILQYESYCRIIRERRLFSRFISNLSSNTFIEDKKDKKKDKKEKEKKDGKLSKHAAAVIGIALIAMGEDIGRYVKKVVFFYRKRTKSICGRNSRNLVIIKFSFSEMSFRTFGHLLRYGEPAVRRAVPLAIALTSISNPQLHIVDTLSKFSHDSDGEVAFNCKFFYGF